MNFEIHRLLDEAFIGVTMSPEVHDFKEELRANLADRATELETTGVSAAHAAQMALAELGDIPVLIREAGIDVESAPHSADSNPQHAAAPSATTWNHQQVRPTPAFVIRTILWAVGALAGFTLSILGATGVLPLPLGPVIGLLGVAATGVGLLVGDSLRQETTTNHPMPENRASGYALATWLAFYGLGFGGLIALGALPLWCVVFVAVGVLSGAAGFIWLGITQTNRHKTFARARTAARQPNRFEKDPAVAARFGIYAGALWVIVFAVSIIIGFTAGWMWSGIPFLLGVAVMLLMLARMMFAPDSHSGDSHQETS